MPASRPIPRPRPRWPGTRPRTRPTSDPALPDDDADEPERGPLRRCAVTRERLPKERMIRFVVGPDRSLVFDLAERLPGRGIWLSARGDVLETARTRGAFARAARGTVQVPPDLAIRLQEGLLRRIGDHLGLARRAAQVVCGYAKTREWIAEGRAAVIVQATDGSPDERRRLLSGARELPVVAVMPADRLAAAFGRDHVVHAALSRGALAGRLVVDGSRFAGLAGMAAPGRTELVGDARPVVPAEGLGQAGT